MRSETSGKLVDKWVYAYRGPENPVDDTEDGEHSERRPLVRDQKVFVNVSIIKELKKTDAPPHETKGVSFLVECELPKFKMIGTDIELLRKEAFARCDEQYATKWEPFFLVKVSRGWVDGMGSGMDFTYREVSRGTGWDGSLLLRDRKYGSREEISAWPGEFRDEQGNVIACIPRTPANTEALEEFSRRIDALRGRIADLLRPATIVETLANLSSNALLPPPEPQLESDHAKKTER